MTAADREARSDAFIDKWQSTDALARMTAVAAKWEADAWAGRHYLRQIDALIKTYGLPAPLDEVGPVLDAYRAYLAEHDGDPLSTEEAVGEKGKLPAASSAKPTPKETPDV